MKLVTSTGDFKFYVPSIAAAVESFKDSKFQFLNLEQTGYIPEFFSDNDDDYKKLADEC